MSKDLISGRRLLYVDDEQKALKYFPICLGDDVEVVACSNALDALAILEAGRERFDAVVSDDRMPNMSGRDLLRIVAVRWPQLSRIITTAYTDVPRLSRMIAAQSVHRVILKPWEPSELRETIGVTIQHVIDNFDTAPPVGRNAAGGSGIEADLFRDVVHEGQWISSPVHWPRRLHPDLQPSALAQLALEFEAARQLEAPQIELRTCTVKECLDEALTLLRMRGPHRADISFSDPRPIYIHSNPSCLGGAIAEFLGSSLVAARTAAEPRISIELQEEQERVLIIIFDNGDWTSDALPSLLFDDRHVENDVRPGVGLAIAAWVARGCGAVVDVVAGRDNQPCIILALLRARN